jgi:hypothetical protein
MKFIITIQPLILGELPRKAIVTPCKTIGDLSTYRVKSLIGSAEMWVSTFDNLIATGEYKINRSL